MYKAEEPPGPGAGRMEVQGAEGANGLQLIQGAALGGWGGLRRLPRGGGT